MRPRRGSVANGLVDELAALSGTRPGTELGQVWGPLLLHVGGQGLALPPTRVPPRGALSSRGRPRRGSASSERKNSTGNGSISGSVRRRTGSDGGSVAGPCAW